MADLLNAAQKQIDEAAKQIGTNPANNTSPSEPSNPSLQASPKSVLPLLGDTTPKNNLPADKLLLVTDLPPEPPPPLPTGDGLTKPEQKKSVAAKTEDSTIIKDNALPNKKDFIKPASSNIKIKEPSTTVPSDQDHPPKPKGNKTSRSKIAILTTILLLFLTIPISAFYVSQRQKQLADVRSKASGPCQSGTCPAGQTCTDEAWGWHQIQCGQGCPDGQGRKVRCNWSYDSGYACVIPGSSGYLNSCEDASGNHHWEPGACEADPSCVTQDKTKNSNTLTFDQGRRLKLYVYGIDVKSSLTITLTNTTNPSQIFTVTTGALPANEGKIFNNILTVPSNNSYNISVQAQGDPGPAYGWIDPSGNLCGKNGHEKDVGPYITAGRNASNPTHQVQCWADAEIGDPTQDYDFNDFLLVFGYENATQVTPTPTPTATPIVTPTPTPITAQCQAIKIYKNGTVVSDLSTLHTGDNIILAVVKRNATKARLRVNGGNFTETTTVNQNSEFTLPYTIPSGIYTFTLEAEVFRDGVWQ